VSDEKSPEKSLFSKFKEENNAPRLTLVPGKKPYKAAELDKSRTGQTRIRLNFKNGERHVLSYHYLIEIIETSHQMLSLVFSSCVITLKGRHLEELTDEFQDEKVRALTCFHAGQYEEPEEGEACILDMVRQNFQEAGRRPQG
jgi:hypothetical protein